MAKKYQIDSSIVKHTGKSVMSDSGSKRVSVKLLAYDDNTTVYQANLEAYGVIFETNNNEITVTITKGGQTIKSIDCETFIEKLFK